MQTLSPYVPMVSKTNVVRVKLPKSSLTCTPVAASGMDEGLKGTFKYNITYNRINFV